MNKTKEKDREAYETPIVTDIAPITVVTGQKGSEVDDPTPEF